MSGTRTCRVTGKQGHCDPRTAEKRRKRIKRRRGEKLHVYRCEHCKLWHLGHDL